MECSPQFSKYIAPQKKDVKQSHSQESLVKENEMFRRLEKKSFIFYYLA
jgi:hypothetical protein